ncbi:MAG: hypothetical protein WCE64_04680, partial [Bacteroidales bacterium]
CNFSYRRMKIINASWDENITGLKTCEITFEKNDTFKAYLDAGIEKDYRFSVVKVPAGDLQLVHQFEETGYRYLENQFRISFDNRQLDTLNQSWTNLLKGFTCKQVSTPGELDLIIREVEGNMFRTDRFSLDPLFSGSDIPSKRYVNWIEELYKKGETQFYTIARHAAVAGFFTLRQESKNVCSCPIAGIYPGYKSAGYIFVLTWFWLQKSRELGTNKLITSISSNNRNILSSLSKVFSFRIDEIKVVMRKVNG